MVKSVVSGLGNRPYATTFDGSKQNTLPTTTQATEPLAIARWARNTRHPNAVLESKKSEAGNQAAMWRTKEVFRAGGAFRNTPLSTPVFRTRWRWAWHSGPYTRQVYVTAVLLPADTGFSTDAYTQLDISDAGANTVSETFHYGASPYGVPYYAPEGIKVVKKLITINPDTDYFATVTDQANGRIQSMCVHEVSSLTDINQGYLPQNFVAQGPILSAYRQNALELARNLWRRGGAHCWNHCSDTDATAFTTSSATFKNFVDNATFANTPDSAGVWLDFSNKIRRSQKTTGVPVKLFAYLQASGAGGGSATITLQLVNSSGVVVGSVVTTNSGGLWVGSTFSMPPIADKYDLLAASSSGTAKVFAASLFEYEV